MDMDGLAKNNCTALKAAVLIVTFLAAASIPAKPAHAQDESIEVSCYKGNLDQGNYTGNVSVNDPRNAGTDCNQEYNYDCQGQCVGCLIDSDSNQVCYDNSGMKFLQ